MFVLRFYLAFTNIFDLHRGGGGGNTCPPITPPIDDTAESTVAEHNGAETPALASIWADDYCKQNGDDSWRCLQCNTTFKPKHATRAAAHFAKKKMIGIKTCPAIVPDADLKRYCDLFDSKGRQGIFLAWLEDLEKELL